MKNIFLYVTLLTMFLEIPCLAVSPSDLKDISYGKDSKQRMDVWLADNQQPTPVIIYIHGGGWRTGNQKLKSGSKQEVNLPNFLAAGISFISIDYRLTNSGNTLPVPVYDAARAIQFIRSKATEWNIDKSRIAIWGGSAGGATCLWLLFHDDLADPESSDPVARESTRVSAAAVQNGQSCIDPYWIEKNIGIEGAKHPMIANAVGENNLDDVFANYVDHEALFTEFSAINHLDANDPPYYGIYQGSLVVPAVDPGKGIHHRMMGIKLKEKSDELGHIGYLSSSNEKSFDDEIDFLETILLQ